MKRIHLGSRGDTIVEVLIVMAVMSLVLAGAFVLTRKGTQGTREGQERGESLKMSQTQAEQVAVEGQDINSELFTDTSLQLFCFNADGDGIIKFVDDHGNPISTLPALGQDDFTKYPGECSDGLYHTSITKDADDVYTIRTRWESPTGNGQDETILRYRVHEPVPPSGFLPGGSLAAGLTPPATPGPKPSGPLSPGWKRRRQVNVTITGSSSIVFCKIDWGDGVIQDILPTCSDPSHIYEHTYPRLGPAGPPYPLHSYQCKIYQITLTVKDSSGQTKIVNSSTGIIPGANGVPGQERAFCLPGTP